jgi:DNA (cytosine-5)-methyltransferase 1
MTNVALHTDINVAEFCAGGAGLGTLALRLVFGSRVKTVVYCERESYAAASLVARMEAATLDQAPVWDNLHTFPSELFRGGHLRCWLPVSAVESCWKPIWN